MDNDKQYKAMSDPTRRKIIELLKEKSLTSGEIANLCEKTQPNISHHLSVLGECGFVFRMKQGMHVYYCLHPKHLETSKQNIGNTLNFKEKLFNEIDLISTNKKCETVLGTESQDEGTLHIMKGAKTIFIMDYSFLLSSFTFHVKIPANHQHSVEIKEFSTNYENSKEINEFLIWFEDRITEIINEDEAAEKEKLSLKGYIFDEVSKEFPNTKLLFTKDETIKMKVCSIIESVLKFKRTPILDISPQASEILEDIIGLGKLQRFMDDDSISDIMIMGTEPVRIGQNNTWKTTDIQFDSHEELHSFVNRICKQLGLTWKENHSSMDVVLPNRARLHIISKEISAKGMVLTIKKLIPKKIEMKELIDWNVLSNDMSLFLERAVKSRANILIIGGTGTGKTTLFNEIGNFSEDDDRIVTIENTRELDIEKPYIVNLLTKNDFTTNDCILTAIKMDCDRLYIEELNDEGVYSFLRLTQIGTNGNIASVIANSVESSLFRLEQLTQQGDHTNSADNIRKLIADSLDIVIFTDRVADGSRKVTEITEVMGYNTNYDAYDLNPLFVWDTESNEHFYTGSSVSNQLADKLNRHGFPTYIEVENEEYQDLEYIQKIEQQLPSICLQLANGIRGGYPLHGVFKVVGEYGEKPFADELLACHKELELGISFTGVLENLKRRIPSSEIALFANALQIEWKGSGGVGLEKTLRHLASALESRQEIINITPAYKRKDESSSTLWQLIDFLDALSLICHTGFSFDKSIELVADMFDNSISREFKAYVKETKLGISRIDAFKNLAKRVKCVEFESFINQMIQGTLFNIGIEDVILSEARKLRSLAKMTYELKYKKRR